MSDMNYAQGALTPLGEKITEDELLKIRAQQAIHVLKEARKVRASPTLMAAVRTYLREQRDEMAALMDEIG